MKSLIVLTVAALLIPSLALAQCPVPGTYTTSNGTLLAGRASEAWCGAATEQSTWGAIKNSIK